MLPLQIRALHAEDESTEQHKQADRDCIQRRIYNSLECRAQLLRRPIDNKSSGQDGEVERRIIMVDVGDASHGDEGEVVEEPADDGVQTRDADMVNVFGRQLVVATLPTNKVPDENQAEDAKRGRAAPVDEWITEEEIFDDLVIPGAHTKANVEDRPLPVHRCQVILLVRVRNESIVGGHHGDVEMDEVLEERRLVLARVTGGNYGMSALFSRSLMVADLRFSL